MGKYQDGIMGRFLGKVGTVIGGKWKKTSYMRAKGSSTRSKFTQAQIEQQAKFKLAMSFIRRMSSLFSLTYKNYETDLTARNKALSNILLEAVTGVYPAYTLDFSKVLVSSGTLNQVLGSTASVAGSIITFNWHYHVDIAGYNPNDQSIVVIYCPARHQSMYKPYASKRSTATASIDASPFTGEEVVTWLTFISEDGKKVGDSVYTGKLTIH